MEASKFATECDIIRLYYENEEAKIINDLYYEASDGVGAKVSEIKERIVRKIKEIIEAIKKFFADIKKKHESAQIEKMLKSACRTSQKEIMAEVNDKQVAAGIASLYKIQQRAFSEARKAYDQFMSHKIDYDTYVNKVDALGDEVRAAQKKVTEQLKGVKLVSEGGHRARMKKLSEVTGSVAKVYTLYDKTLGQMRDDVIKEEQRLSAVAERSVTDSSESTATSKHAATISSIGKGVAATVIAVAAIAVSARFCYNKGFQTGQTKGYEAGHRTGRAAGEIIGQKRGHEQGLKEGKLKGFTKGKQMGLNTGRREGIAAGREEGYKWGEHYGHERGVKEGTRAGYKSGYAQGVTDVFNDNQLDNGEWRHYESADYFSDILDDLRVFDESVYDDDRLPDYDEFEESYYDDDEYVESDLLDDILESADDYNEYAGAFDDIIDDLM